MFLLRAENLNFSFRKGEPFINNFNVDIEQGSFVSVIGRNGAGKSTLIKLIAGIFKPDNGKISINGRELSDYKSKELSAALSYLPQFGLPLYEDLLTKEFLLMGRYSHKSFYEFGYSNQDFGSIHLCSELTGITNLMGKELSGLSGGERQKVLITLSLVQLNPQSSLENKLLLIDEPLTYLDISHQIELFELLKKLNTDKGLTIIAVTHDLNLSMRYCGKTLLMDGGKSILYDNTESVINQNNLKDYFGIKADFLKVNNNHQVLFFN